MDLIEKLQGNCSPYIANLVYDIDVRLLFIELMDDPDEQNPKRRIVFPEISEFAESNALNAPDDESIDDLMGINQAGAGKLVIRTYKKEITLTLTGEPFWEKID